MANCFKCSGEVATYEYCGIKFDICKSCNSVVITKENFEAMCRKVDACCEIVDLFALPAVKLKEADRKCCYCENTMEKIYCNGVVIDRCKKCNILVFDNGELSKYFSKFSNSPVEITGNAKFIQTLCGTETPQTPAVQHDRYRQPSALKIVSKVNEKNASYIDGWVMVFLLIVAGIVSIFTYFTPITIAIGVIIDLAILFMLNGFCILKPQEAVVYTLFGDYIGTLKREGFYWVNPFASSLSENGSGIISLKARTLNNAKQKINDSQGNPVEIGIMVTWEVQDTAKAIFNVNNYSSFLSAQCDSALRNITRLYPYDAPEESGKQSLRGDSAEISEKLKVEIQNNVYAAGIRILDARITHLAYSSEIAAAMLQRQQANAVIDAKRALVEGAVGMVEMALDKLAANPNVTLDEKTKANMVNNLLVVLCGNKESQPVLRSDEI